MATKRRYPKNSTGLDRMSDDKQSITFYLSDKDGTYDEQGVFSCCTMCKAVMPFGESGEHLCKIYLKEEKQ